MINLIGYCAAFLTTLAFLPQVILIVRTHSTRDVSLPTFIICSAGVLMWFIYGVLVKDSPLIVANFVTFLLYGVILIYKIRYK